MSATLVNLQRKIAIDTSSLSAFANSILNDVAEANGKTVAIAFVSDRRMKQLNSFFRDKNATTDVLSFPHQPDQFDPDTSNLGDIVISVEQAAKQAADSGVTLENEIKQLILHGFLHLCGYDHENDNGEMNRRELVLRRQLKI